MTNHDLLFGNMLSGMVGPEKNEYQEKVNPSGCKLSFLLPFTDL